MHRLCDLAAEVMRLGRRDHDRLINGGVDLQGLWLRHRRARQWQAWPDQQEREEDNGTHTTTSIEKWGRERFSNTKPVEESGLLRKNRSRPHFSGRGPQLGRSGLVADTHNRDPATVGESGQFVRIHKDGTARLDREHRGPGRPQ